MPEDFQRDQDLQRRIESFLFQRHIGALRRVHVAVNNGCVAIQGRVNSFHEKQLCLNCCQRVAGVTRITDQVEVA